MTKATVGFTGSGFDVIDALEGLAVNARNEGTPIFPSH